MVRVYGMLLQCARPVLTRVSDAELFVFTGLALYVLLAEQPRRRAVSQRVSGGA